ncbi:hypothetical protein SAMD00019534_081740 [Acytostelium subglobosum LB1]|uniref:hypothetical protein n=1 Tax=Acytostelium subglobosum LB1 TaxID=1410327 RepID=UPI0006448535|nr:hypothetical protein SAMD00019534_081740 [Acytostelium subglobosum LB1]GAM24999.1 hypothetical protein SAMD00019534_081740 [Acytostelium subglobosum LB1]|eukprot:XP_012752088.1 hypothetical protein SAMD00019534_081740 [Acytostelium subglobosum LB1]
MIQYDDRHGGDDDTINHNNTHNDNDNDNDNGNEVEEEEEGDQLAPENTITLSSEEELRRRLKQRSSGLLSLDNLQYERTAIDTLKTSIVQTTVDVTNNSLDMFNLELDLSANKHRMKLLATKLNELKQQMDDYESDIEELTAKSANQQATHISLQMKTKILRKSYQHKVDLLNEKKRMIEEAELATLDPRISKVLEMISLRRAVNHSHMSQEEVHYIAQPAPSRMPSHIELLTPDRDQSFVGVGIGVGVGAAPQSSSTSSSSSTSAPNGRYQSPLACLRSYRHSPNYSLLSPFTHSSSTYSTKLNPRRKLCMYELDGVCRDPNCKFLHVRDFKMTNKEIIEDLLTYSNSNLDKQQKDVILTTLNEDESQSTLTKAAKLAESIVGLDHVMLELNPSRERAIKDRNMQYLNEMEEAATKRQNRLFASITALTRPKTTRPAKRPREEDTTSVAPTVTDESEDFLPLLADDVAEPSTTGPSADDSVDTDGEDEDVAALSINQEVDSVRLSGASGVSTADYMKDPTSVAKCIGYLCTLTTYNVLANESCREEVLIRLRRIVENNSASLMYWKIYIEVYSRKYTNSSKEIEALIDEAAEATGDTILLPLMKLRLPSSLPHKLSICTHTLTRLMEMDTLSDSSESTTTPAMSEERSFWTLELLLIYLRYVCEAGWRDFLLLEFLAFYNLESAAALFVRSDYDSFKHLDPLLSVPHKASTIRSILAPQEQQSLKLVFITLLLFNVIPDTTDLYINGANNNSVEPKQFTFNWDAYFGNNAYLQHSPQNVDAIKIIMETLDTTSTGNNSFTLNHLSFLSRVQPLRDIASYTNTLLESQPNNIDAWLFLADCYCTKGGKHKDIIILLQEALRLNASSFKLIHYYTLYLIGHHQHIEAIKEVDHFVNALYSINQKQTTLINDERIDTTSLLNILLGRSSNINQFLSVAAVSMTHSQIDDNELVNCWLTFSLYAYLKRDYKEVVSILKDATNSHLNSMEDKKQIWKELLHVITNSSTVSNEIDNLVDQFFQEVPTEFYYPFGQYNSMVPSDAPQVLHSALKPPCLKDYSAHNQVFDLYRNIKNNAIPLLKKCVYLFPDNDHMFSMYVKMLSGNSFDTAVKSILKTITPKRAISLAIWKLSLQAAIDSNLPEQQITKLYRNVLSYYPYNQDLWMEYLSFEEKTNPARFGKTLKANIDKAELFGVNVYALSVADRPEQ